VQKDLRGKAETASIMVNGAVEAHFFWEIQLRDVFRRLAHHFRGIKMKFTPILFAAAASLAVLTGSASADDINQLCIDTVTADQTAAGQTVDAAAVAANCGCLAEKASADHDLTDNIVEVAALPAADREAKMSEATGAAIAACFPQPAAE
jgi:hypothetical protein